VAIWSLRDQLTSRPVRRVAVDIDICDLLLQTRKIHSPTPTIGVVPVDGCFGGTRSDVPVCLLWVGVGGRVTVDLLLALPVLKLPSVLDILF
jgi:hypothetical protein